ncbi:hypothetical protein [Campylobacter hyointestinalis]|uniref:hypothetical protein n=1 Tax=Campylobacter hyointestinalis TaxID=198 RepID=UPI000DCEBB7A|nr:hypothetical protein [Campylobacter hyointestinalis]RAZ49968.1 hypothetical protein CHL9004_04135 [Campylobacter hyointestinalis subsp. lawsonii]
MKNFLFLSFLVVSLASFSFAADLLASLTNGKISDNSPGVKVLSLEEAKQVKGGYITRSGHGVGEFYGTINERYNGKPLMVVGKKYGQTLISGFSIYLAYYDGSRVPLVDNGRGLEIGLKSIPSNRDTHNILSQYIDTAKIILNNVNPQFPR